MKLVDDFRDAWKWISMHAMAWPAAAISSWLAIPKEWQDFVLANVPAPYLLGGIGAVLALGMLGRVVDQK